MIYNSHRQIVNQNEYLTKLKKYLTMTVCVLVSKVFGLLHHSLLIFNNYSIYVYQNIIDRKTLRLILYLKSKSLQHFS